MPRLTRQQRELRDRRRDWGRVAIGAAYVLTYCPRCGAMTGGKPHGWQTCAANKRAAESAKERR